MCCNMLGDDPGTPEGPMEMAGSQVVEAMGGEVPAQQTEQDELTWVVAQPHLKEERCVRWDLAHVHFYTQKYARAAQ